MPPDSTPNAAPPRKDAFAALRYPEFRNLILANVLLTCGRLIQEVTIGYELYRITGNALMLGLVGLAQVIPFMAVALFGGHVADRRDKRRLMAMAQGVMLLGSVVLAWIMWSSRSDSSIADATELTLIYATMAAMGFARAFYSPAIRKPGSAGFEVNGTLLIVVAMMVLSLLATLRMSAHPPREIPKRESVWKSLGEGLGFVWRSPLILYAITLDMVAVLCGGVIAILPVFSIDILHVGPQGLGILRAAPAVGAMLTMLICTAFTPTHRPWRNLLLAVVGFGMATLVFALSKLFWLSVLALFLTGIFDAVSVVIRQTILQALPPDHVRGRVLSVSSIFVSASNELGAFTSSAMVRFLGAVPGVLVGAALTLASVGYMWKRGKGLDKVRVD